MSISTSAILRIELDKNTASFVDLVTSISQAGGDIVAIDVIQEGKEKTVRDITVTITDNDYEFLLDSVKSIPGINLKHVSDRTFLVHLGGKLEIRPKTPVKNRDDLSRIYTPGVARVCKAIHEDPNKAYSLTIKRNTIAVVSDGTAVLGLGDIGPEAAMPVMEGKAVLFKQLADVDAFPICLDTKDPNEIVRIIKGIAPSFGGINLEDISSPRCFEIERRLREELSIPVFHDDQHGTAVVILAGLLNALKLVGKSIDRIRIVVVGVGAAGVACCKMLLTAGVKELLAVDLDGILCPDVEYSNEGWKWVASHTNPNNLQGGLSEAIMGADVFIGLSRKGIMTVDHLCQMEVDPIIFAMANPEPEISPEDAAPYVRVMATGRSDYPNQINNVLCFPGLFRGVLDCRAAEINEEMKLAAAEAIASAVEEDELNELYIIPSIFNEKVVQHVRAAVIRTAIETGVAKRIPPEYK
ncbi:MAG: malate dehydrogenase [Bacilli bacterium]|nr:malate dehydrogenase [Bacilli bacterium]